MFVMQSDLKCYKFLRCINLKQCREIVLRKSKSVHKLFSRLYDVIVLPFCVLWKYTYTLCTHCIPRFPRLYGLLCHWFVRNVEMSENSKPTKFPENTKFFQKLSKFMKNYENLWKFMKKCIKRHKSQHF